MPSTTSTTLLTHAGSDGGRSCSTHLGDGKHLVPINWVKHDEIPGGSSNAITFSDPTSPARLIMTINACALCGSTPSGPTRALSTCQRPASSDPRRSTPIASPTCSLYQFGLSDEWTDRRSSYWDHAKSDDHHCHHSACYAAQSGDHDLEQSHRHVRWLPGGTVMWCDWGRDSRPCGGVQVGRVGIPPGAPSGSMDDLYRPRNCSPCQATRPGPDPI